MSTWRDFGSVTVDSQDWDNEIEIILYDANTYLSADEALEMGNYLIELANKIKEKSDK